MKKTTLTLALLAIILSACSKPKSENSTESTPPNEVTATQPAAPETPASSSALVVGDNTENSLDWNGEYEGVLPCADCEGIKTELELKNDKTYELSEEYLGKGKGNEHKVKGTFKFDSENSSIIVLDQAGDNRKYFVGEGFAEARAVETGEAITGPLAAHYKLKKQP